MITQQTLLRDAMRRLNLTRDQFAAVAAVKRRTLDSWLAREASSDSRTMPDSMRIVVEHLLQEAGLPPASFEPAGEAPFGGTRHLLSVQQLSRQTLERIFRVADLMQPYAGRRRVSRVLEGAVLANLFFEPSTRTRLSFGAAFARLGGSVLDTTGFTFSSMAKGESIHDTARVVAGYADVMVVRHPEVGSVAQFAEACHIPVINGGDGAGEHPTQALLDLYTIQREFSLLGKQIDGATVAVIGDLRFGRTVHSLLRSLTAYDGLTFVLCSPNQLALPEEIAEEVRAAGHTIERRPTPAEAISDVDVVYATRIQKERRTMDVDATFGTSYRIDRALVEKHLPDDALLLHPLPRDSAQGAHDLADDLAGDPRLVIFRQTDNGVAVRMAVFAEALGVSHLVARDASASAWFVPETFGTGDIPRLPHA